MLARQLLIAFLAVTVPGTLLLGVVTLYSLHSMGKVSGDLAEITLSLGATRDLHLVLSQAESPLSEYLVRRDPRERKEFGALIQAAEDKLVSCSSSACHSQTKTPAQMAASLAPDVEHLRTEGEAILASASVDANVDRARIEAVHELIGEMRRKLHRMSGALLVRVEDLGDQARRVSRRASLIGASLTAAIVLVACGAAVLIAGRIARPLRDLLKGIRRVMTGDWSYRVEVKNRGEIGELATSFNAMVRELEQYRGRLEESNRTLEARVQERTEALKAKEQELLQSEKLASLGLLAAGVAHELNNPLTSIVMNANLMIEEVGETSPLYRDLRRIDADAARCKRIIEDLRAFARRRDLQKTLASVEAALEQALWSAGHELEGRSIKVERLIEPGLPSIVWDPDRMVQVLTNLFVNAAQAMEPGGRLGVRAFREDGWLRIQVEDNGAGIPPEHRTMIFDPFFTTKSDGTGLGLSITHGIVNEHGGRIELESRTRAEGGESGTTITIVLPIAEVTA